MLDHAAIGGAARGDFVDFVKAGTPVMGAYQCSECGYGVTVHAELPRCPMCSGTSWEGQDSRPATEQPPLL